MKVNKKVLAGAGLLAAALVGGTFAYFNETLFIDNPLDTGNYNTVLYEEFKPTGDGEELKPGQHWKKEVGAKNTGDYPVLVRIKMSESWARQNDNGELKPYQELDSVKNYDKFIVEPPEDSDNWIFNAYQPPEDEDPAGDTDGIVPSGPDGDSTVVYKHLLDDSGWVNGEDGYWYWNGVLEKKGSPRDTTGLIMDELVLAENVDMGAYKDTEYYAVTEEEPAKDSEEWTEVPENSGTILEWANKSGFSAGKYGITGDMTIDAYLKSESGKGKKLWRKSESKIIDKAHRGYSDSVYTLLIESDFVQATKNAVAAAWGSDAAKIVDGLSNIGVDSTDGVNYVNEGVPSQPSLPPGEFGITLPTEGEVGQPPTEGETSPAGSEPAAP